MDRYLPPSPNWYCTRIIDVNSKGFLAYGSRNHIILLKLLNVTDEQSDSDSRFNFNYYGTLTVHTKRITGIKFSDVNPNLLASVGEDNLVNVVELETRKVLFKHETHKEKVNCITWTSSNDLATCVVSGDESGLVVVANIHSKKLKDYLPFKSAITCLSCCKHAPHLTAIGYFSGKVIVIDLSNRGSIVCDVKQHDGDILSLCWAPYSGHGLFESDLNNLLDNREASETDYLLASSSRDKLINIWSVYHGLSVRTMVIPFNVGDGFPKRAGDQAKNSNWVTMDWPENQKDTLLSSSLSGSLLSWDLSRTKKPWIVVDKEKHHRIRPTFNIVTFKNAAVTLSLDRFMTFWTFDETGGHCNLSVPTIGGNVYKLNFSPINSGILAIGCGDATIRVWNTTSNNPYDVLLFWQGLKTRVHSLAWHPKKEGILAFGTANGDVGIYNVLTTKPPSISNAKHLYKAVYTVCWGPACPTQGNSDLIELYSCGGGTIFIHHLPLDKGAVNINKLLREFNPSSKKYLSWTEVSWKPDYSLLCLGSSNGSIELYNAVDLRLLIILPGISGKNYIFCLSWHPQYLFNAETPSKCQHFLAVASQVPIVYIYDLSDILDKGVNQLQIESPLQIASYTYKLAEHKDAIASLVWSTHYEGQMITTSFDGTACVWDVIERKVLACYNGHQARVLCAEWNSTDPNAVFSGGEDFTLRTWRISEQDNKLDNKYFESKVKPKKIQKDKVKSIQREELSSTATSKVKNLCGDDNDKPNIGNLPEEYNIEMMLEKRRNEILGATGNFSNEINLRTSKENEPECETRDNLLSVNKHVLHSECKYEEEVANHTNLIQHENVNANGVVNDKDVNEVISTQRSSVESVKIVNSDDNNDEEEAKEEGVPQSNLVNKNVITASVIAKTKKKKKKVDKTLFPITNRKETAGKHFTLNDCVVLTDHLAGNSSDNKEKFGIGSQVHLGVYGDRMDAYRLLKSEADNHIENGNLELALQLEIWKGNITEALNMAAKHEQLSDGLVALAASVSTQFWSDMCVLYAKQLVNCKQPHRAVLFLLANHKVHEAIDLLKTRVSYREAIILAKFRIPKDPVIAQLVDEWAEEWLKVESNDCAAKCYVSIGKFDEASKVLGRKHDPSSVKVAAYIAKKCGNKTQEDLYSKQCVSDCLVCCQFAIASEVILEHPDLRPFRVVIEIHKVVSGENWKKSIRDEKVNENILSFAREVISAETDGSANVDELLTSFFTVISSSHLLSGTSNENEMEAWISLNFVLVAIQTLQKDLTGALNRILDMFVETVNRLNGFYLPVLARALCDLNNMSSLRATENLNVLLGTHNDSLVINDLAHLWSAILGFLSLARLHELLKYKFLPTSDDLNVKITSEDAQIVFNVLLDENRARLTMLKSRLIFINIAITVLTSVKSVNNSADCEDIKGSEGDAASTVLEVVFYDDILGQPDVSIFKLITEKNNTEEEISLLSQSILMEKFPDTFQSCTLISELSLLDAGEFWDKLFKEAIAFGDRIVVTRRQFSILENLKQQFSKK